MRWDETLCGRTQPAGVSLSLSLSRQMSQLLRYRRDATTHWPHSMISTSHYRVSASIQLVMRAQFDSIASWIDSTQTLRDSIQWCVFRYWFDTQSKSEQTYDTIISFFQASPSSIRVQLYTFVHLQCSVYCQIVATQLLAYERGNRLEYLKIFISIYSPMHSRSKQS